MKKILSIAVALMMVMALSICVFADDEVVYEYTVPGPVDTNGSWWDTSSGLTSSDADFVAAIQTEGTMLRIECDAVAVDGAEGHGFQYGFQCTSGNWTMATIHSNFANGEGVCGADEIVVNGDRAYIYVDAPAFYALAKETIEGAGDSIDSWQWISGQCTGKNYSIAVVKHAAAEAPAETEAPAAETEAPAETTAETEEPASTPAPEAPKTGLALAVVPAVMALAAVAVSKKH